MIDINFKLTITKQNIGGKKFIIQLTNPFTHIFIFYKKKELKRRQITFTVPNIQIYENFQQILFTQRASY